MSDFSYSLNVRSHRRAPHLRTSGALRGWAALSLRSARSLNTNQFLESYLPDSDDFKASDKTEKCAFQSFSRGMRPWNLCAVWICRYRAHKTRHTGGEIVRLQLVRERVS